MRLNLACNALRSSKYEFLISFIIALLPLPCFSEDGSQQQLSELLQMDINELMDLKVTLPSRHEDDGPGLPGIIVRLHPADPCGGRAGRVAG